MSTEPQPMQPGTPLDLSTARPSAAESSAAMPHVMRNTMQDTWRWMWKDVLLRILPFATASGLYVYSLRARDAKAEEKATLARAVGQGVAYGIPLAFISALFRGWVAPYYRLPTRSDQALQTTYYFVVNAPAEEIFWRGTVQPLVIGGLARLPATKRTARPLGWALTTLSFGLYHRLGRWSWRSIAGVTVAGGLFGALALGRGRGRGLLSATIAHAFATAGFLSWGDVLLHLWNRRRRG